MHKYLYKNFNLILKKIWGISFLTNLKAYDLILE